MDDICDFGDKGPRLGDRFCFSFAAKLASEILFLPFGWPSLPFSTLIVSEPRTTRFALGISLPWLELSVARIGGVELVLFIESEDELLN